MNGRIQARVKEVAKQAFYVHCNADCLNLVLVDTVKAVPEVECFFSSCAKIVHIHVWVLCSHQMAQ